MSSPYKSNTKKTRCEPVSSNCVFLPETISELYSLCEDSSVSDALKTIKDLLDSLTKELDLSSNDLSYLWKACTACKEPDVSIKNVIQLLTDKVQSLEEIINKTATNPEGNNLVLPSCLWYKNSAGDTVTSLPIESYVKVMGNALCTYVDRVSNFQTSLDQIDIRVGTVEKKIDSLNTSTTVNSICVAPGATDSTPKTLSVENAFEFLEKDYCTVKSLLGSQDELAKGITDELQPTGSPSGVYQITNPSSLLWTQQANVLGVGLSHMWAAIKDLRSTVSLLRQQLKVDCSSIVIDFDAKRVMTDNLETLTLFFNTKSKVPLGFQDTDNIVGNKFTIQDNSGNIYTHNIKIADAINQSDGVEIDLSRTPLNSKDLYTITGDISMSSGDFTCVKCVNKEVTFPSEGCGICYITAVSGSSTNSSAVVSYIDKIGDRKLISFRGGDQKIIPPDAKNITVSMDGNMILTSNCASIQSQLLNIEDYTCMSIVWPEQNSNDSSPWTKNNTIAYAVGLGNKEYEFSEKHTIAGGEGILSQIKKSLPENSTIGGSFEVHRAGDKYWIHKVVVKVPTSLASTFYVRFDSNRKEFSDTRIYGVVNNSERDYPNIKLSC